MDQPTPDAARVDRPPRRTDEPLEARDRRLPWQAIAETLARMVPAGVVVWAAGSGSTVLLNEQARLLASRAEGGWATPDDVPIEPAARSHEGGSGGGPGWPLDRALREGEHVTDEPITVTRGDGSPATLLVSAAPVTDDAGAIVAGIQTMVDVSDRRIADLPRDTFLAVLSHEIMTPLTSILGDSALLLQAADRLPPQTRGELLQDTVAEAERLRSVVDNLIVLAHLEAGHEPARPEPLRIGPILERAVRRARATPHGPSISTSIEPALPIVSADGTSLEQVVSILLTNAAVHGGERTLVTAERRSGEVVIAVRDDGPGLGDLPAERLFELFTTRPTRATGRTGLGIGLYVAARLTAMMDGRIWGRDLLGTGAEFGVAIPVLEESSRTRAQGEEG